MNAINRKKSKIYVDDIKFDSQAEADFYSRYVKNCGYKYDIHPYRLHHTEDFLFLTYQQP